MLMDTFQNLQVLELRNNQFISLKVSSGPESPAQDCPHSQTAGKCRNHSDSILFKGLVPLKSLKKLYLAQNKIEDLTPLAKLKSLETLHLRENEISSLLGLNELTQLKEINVRTNQILQINEFDNLTNATQ